MSAPNRKPSPDESWVEYRLLILAELERLNECVERLREQDASVIREARQEIATTCRKMSAYLNERLQTTNTSHTFAIQTLVDRIATLENAAKWDSQTEKRKDKWAFWTAVITIVGTLIASIVSLVLSLQQRVVP